MMIGHPTAMFLGLNNSYSRQHCADANDACVTIVLVAVVVLIGQQCDLYHCSYCFGSFYRLHRHQWLICGLALHFVLKMTVLLMVNSNQSDSYSHVLPMMHAFGDALAVVENAFDESIL